MKSRAFSQRAVSGSLTRQETLVTRWLADGKQTQDVACILGISSKSVEVHAHNSMKKLGAENRAELTIAAIRNGIVPCPCPLCPGSNPKAVAESPPKGDFLERHGSPHNDWDAPGYPS
jgi:DNA-binding CsgD family transcriptional regulator